MSASDHEPIVYYATSRFGGQIKIGSTINLPRRIRTLSRAQPGMWGVVVLATEPGSYDVEAARQEQFARYRFRGEWFWPSPELTDFIRDLSKETNV